MRYLQGDLWRQLHLSFRQCPCDPEKQFMCFTVYLHNFRQTDTKAEDKNQTCQSLCLTYNVAGVTWLSSVSSVSRRALGSGGGQLIKTVQITTSTRRKRETHGRNSLCHLGDLLDLLPCCRLPARPERSNTETNSRNQWNFLLNQMVCVKSMSVLFERL